MNFSNFPSAPFVSHHMNICIEIHVRVRVLVCEHQSKSRFDKSNTRTHNGLLANNKKYCLHLSGLDTFFDVICWKSDTPSAYDYVCMAGRRWQCGLNNYVK